MSQVQTQIHELPLLPKGQHLSYFEGYNPDNPAKLRRIMDEAFQESLQNGMKVARVEINWSDVEPTKGAYNKQELIDRLQFYHSRDLSIYLLLGTTDTYGLNYPRDLLTSEGDALANDMQPDDPVIVERYSKMLDWAMPIAREHGVYCISVGNEPDMYHEDDSAFVPHFIKFVTAIRTYAHTIDPDIAITYTSTCDPILHSDRKYSEDIADSVDILCFNFHGFGKSNLFGLGKGQFDRKETDKIFDKMIELSKGKPIQIQKLSYSSIRNPDANWMFHDSSEAMQNSFFHWAFEKIRATEQVRVVYVFQLAEHSYSIDRLYFDIFAAVGIPDNWSRDLCDWLKGTGMIKFDSAKKKPAWDEFLKGLRLIYGESG